MLLADNQSRTNTRSWGGRTGAAPGIGVGRRKARRLATINSRQSYQPLGEVASSPQALSSPPRGASGQASEKLAYQRQAVVETGCAVLDAHSVLPGEAVAPVLLDQRDQLGRIEIGPGTELQLRALGPRVDTDDAQALPGDAQAVAGQKRLRRLGRQPETVD